MTRTDVQQDFTVNNDLGFRFTDPLPDHSGIHLTFSGGLDYKTFVQTSFKTNQFQFEEFTVNAQGDPNPPIISTVNSPVPVTRHPVNYLPLNLRYDGSVPDPLGNTSFGLGVVANLWFSGSLANIQGAVGSTNSQGHWVAFLPSVTHDFNLPHSWTLSLHTEGQWASEPLLSVEQFGIGGVSNIRGYREGEVFGDDGWRSNFESKTPVHVVGVAWGNLRLTVRGSMFMDYGQVFLIDPQGRPPRTDLWGTGLGGVASIGAYWEARLLASFPLLSTDTTPAYEPRFNFDLTAQF